MKPVCPKIIVLILLHSENFNLRLNAPVAMLFRKNCFKNRKLRKSLGRRGKIYSELSR